MDITPLIVKIPKIKNGFTLMTAWSQMNPVKTMLSLMQPIYFFIRKEIIIID